jgi:hypothetical protein
MDFGRLKDFSGVGVPVFELWGAIDQAADDELVQMGVGPSESFLNDFVQLRKV